MVFGFLVIFPCFTWPFSEHTNVAKFWRFPNHPFSLVALWSVAALHCLAQDKKFGRDGQATTEGFGGST
jgi:hypothetical protein